MGLRWTIGIIAAVVGVGFFLLATAGSAFRASFGGSDQGPWVDLAPLLVAFLIVATVLWPDRRVLLHVTAILMAALVIGSGFLMKETVFIGSCGVVFGACWFLFYYRAIWAPAAAVP
jgi:hypothetical protein